MVGTEQRTMTGCLHSVSGEWRPAIFHGQSPASPAMTEGNSMTPVRSCCRLLLRPSLYGLFFNSINSMTSIVGLFYHLLIHNELNDVEFASIFDISTCNQGN